ncbi:MAG: elongation factor P [Deltaproteobacteria bacterium]|nr:elongation factor P [Deltaproteobacteria bacterium]MBW2071839.1 elongation factor P [Deltaproteobacteria bacterium]
MYSTSDFRRGLKIELDGKPYLIVEFLHVKPGKGGAFVRTKLKNMETGQVLERTFRSGEKVERPDLVEREMQFLYRDTEGYCFMDNNNYEQIFIDEEHLGDAKNFLKENTDVKVLFFNNKPIGIDLPNFVDLAIVQTEPGVRGDTATGATKPATLETGVVVQVPLFLNEGDLVKVDTRSGEYIERVKQ